MFLVIRYCILKSLKLTVKKYSQPLISVTENLTPISPLDPVSKKVLDGFAKKDYESHEKYSPSMLFYHWDVGVYSSS